MKYSRCLMFKQGSFIFPCSQQRFVEVRIIKYEVRKINIVGIRCLASWSTSIIALQYKQKIRSKSETQLNNYNSTLKKMNGSSTQILSNNDTNLGNAIRTCKGVRIRRIKMTTVHQHSQKAQISATRAKSQWIVGQSPLSALTIPGCC